MLDVVEHVDDYMGFLRALRERARRHVFYIPLDLNAEFALRSWPLVSARQTVGHINSFTKDVALAALEEAGYTARDHFYAPWVLDLADRGDTRRGLRRLATRALWRLDQDLCARALSGFALVVLAEPRQQ